jgi:hypothetical protein
MYLSFTGFPDHFMYTSRESLPVLRNEKDHTPVLMSTNPLAVTITMKETEHSDLSRELSVQDWLQDVHRGLNQTGVYESVKRGRCSYIVH